MKKITITILALLICALPVLAGAGELSLGVSEQNNSNQAVGQAAQRAQANLLLQRAARELPPEQLAANWERFSESVFNNPFPYINSFRTLAISRQEGQTWVLLDVEVNEMAFKYLLDDIKASSSQLKLEHILCLVREHTTPSRYWWSGQPGLAACPPAIARGLRQLGYAPFDPASILSALEPDISKNFMLSKEQAVALGAMAGVKLVLWGEIREYQDSSLPLLQLALVDVTSGQVLSQVEADGALNEGKAPADLAAAINQEAADALSGLFAQAGVEAKPLPQMQVIVELRGTSSTGETRRLERLLARLDGLVTGVQRESISLGKATFLVSTTENGLVLADALEKVSEPGWRIKVLERTPTRLVISPLQSGER